MNSRDAIKILNGADLIGFHAEFPINDIAYDSRSVRPGSAFVALSGAKADGHAFIAEAVRKGASMVVVEKKESAPANIPCAVVKDSRDALAALSDAFFGHPSRKLELVGVTGTNGKTTITYLLKSIAETAGFTTGIIGTIQYLAGGKEIAAPTTTPESYEFQKLLSIMVASGAKYAFAEASSHALVQKRVSHVRFRTAVFTNLTRDHLDYHKTMEAYRDAKSILFEGLGKDDFAVLNCDDPVSAVLASRTKARTFLYGMNDITAQFRANVISLSARSTEMKIYTPAGEFVIKTPLIGLHNISNILAAAGAAHSLGFSPEQIRSGIEAMGSVRGRLEQVICGQDFTVVVDYAHTDDALKNVLTALKAIGNHRVITVFGCGGDRDRGKRPLMGATAEAMSDFTVVTSDNPRSEDPGFIASEITAGMKDRSRYKVVLDRRDAIKEALALAKKDDIVLIAGKGHENYQIFKDRTVHFNDKETVCETLGGGK